MRGFNDTSAALWDAHRESKQCAILKYEINVEIHSFKILLYSKHLGFK